MKENIIVQKTFQFSLDIIALSKNLLEHHEYVLSKQLFRSGTSIGANVVEATAGQSKKDSIAKMAIASKEARETRYWLQLLQQSQLMKADYTDYLLKLRKTGKSVMVSKAQVNLVKSSFDASFKKRRICSG